MIGNVLVIVTIVKGTKSVGNFRRNAKHLAAAEIFFATCGLVNCTSRIGNIIADGFAYNHECCAYSRTAILCAVAAVNAQSFCLAFDRLLGICFPIWYHNLPSKYCQGLLLNSLNILMWSVSLSTGLFMYMFGYAASTPPFCAVQFIFTRASFRLYVTSLAALALATISCYFVILCQYRFCPKMNFNREDNSIAKTVGIITVCHFLSLVIMALGSAIFAQLPNTKIGFAATPYLTLLGALSGTITLPLYLWMQWMQKANPKWERFDGK